MIKTKLKPTREGYVHSVEIDDHKLYIRTGEYDDGTLGELFIALDKEGTELRVYDAVAIAISIGLQYGVPLSDYVDKFEHMQMQPRGFTTNPEIRNAKSIPDYLVAKWLRLKYLGGK